MYVGQSNGAPVIYDNTIAELQTISRWLRVWDELPPSGTIAPVWDGQHLYYAAFWDRDGRQFWVISEQMGVGLEDIDQRKKVGEQVMPIHWLRLEPPKT